MGRPAKPDDMRIRRNKPVEKTPTMPEWDGIIRGPELPPTDPQGRSWDDNTLRWYETWRKSPQAVYAMDTDWEGMYMAAVLHNTVMNGVSHTAMVGLTGEIRKREGSFGGSIEDRRRIGMGDPSGSAEVEQEAVIQQEVRKIVSYAERLGGCPPAE